MPYHGAVPGAYQYLPLERVIFGKPAAQAAAEEAARIGAKRVFVVSSKTLSRSTDEISRIRKSLGSTYAGLFDECIAHTPWPSVLAAAAAVREARPDLILTVGENSVPTQYTPIHWTEPGGRREDAPGRFDLHTFRRQSRAHTAAAAD